MKSNLNNLIRPKSDLTFYNNEADAFKHILWATLNSLDLGESKAREFMNAHETFASNPFNELVMHLHNNELGYQLANKYREQYKSALKTRSSIDNSAVMNSIVDNILTILYFNLAITGEEYKSYENGKVGQYIFTTDFETLKRISPQARETLVRVLEQINNIR